MAATKLLGGNANKALAKEFVAHTSAYSIWANSASRLRNLEVIEVTHTNVDNSRDLVARMPRVLACAFSTRFERLGACNMTKKSSFTM
jgi:hypothetical protein